MREHRRLCPLAAMLLIPIAGCNTGQATFFPKGAEAERVNTLFWVMTGSGGVILLLVCLLTAIAILGSQQVRGWLTQERFVIGTGVAFPVVVLTALLTYGLLVMNPGSAGATSDGGLKVAISGEQWWWRVTYTDAAGNLVESANELHIPTGQPVSIELTTADVIHSFWVPQLAGKLDMIPGRTNVLTLTATEEGVSRGQCAEYCGGAHAFMSFHVVAQDEQDFGSWMEAEAGPARVPGTNEEKAGEALFIRAGCGSCHAVRGTDASGSIGPDLTHVGSRRSLAAATLPNNAESFARWIRDNQHIKPGNRMPPYRIFSEEELFLLARYLDSLE